MFSRRGVERDLAIASSRGGSDKKDFCCAKSCEKLGGPRTCSQAACPAPIPPLQTHFPLLVVKGIDFTAGCSRPGD